MSSRRQAATSDCSEGTGGRARSWPEGQPLGFPQVSWRLKQTGCLSAPVHGTKSSEEPRSICQAEGCCVAKAHLLAPQPGTVCSVPENAIPRGCGNSRQPHTAPHARSRTSSPWETGPGSQGSENTGPEWSAGSGPKRQGSPPSASCTCAYWSNGAGGTEDPGLNRGTEWQGRGLQRANTVRSPRCSGTLLLRGLRTLTSLPPSRVLSTWLAVSPKFQLVF